MLRHRHRACPFPRPGARASRPLCGWGGEQVLDLTGPGSGLVGRMVGRKLAQVLATENAGFKRVTESAER